MRTDEILTSRTAAVREKKKEVTKQWVLLTKDQRAGIKPAILTAMRNAWGETGLDWFDACVALEEDTRYGFLYGTGGNEGSADITNNFWELIEDTIGLPAPKQDSQESLASAVFGGPRLGGTSKTAGQHFPLAAGSSNCGQKFFGYSSANPWDVILMMEGAVLFAGATTKRLSQHGKGKAAFPFMLDHLATEGPAASVKDEAKQDGNVIRCRAEFWMPLWSQPSTLPGVRALLAEGRLQRPSGTFAVIRKDQPLLFHWPDLTLNDQLLADLKLILGRMTYFGRAESWCQAGVHADAAPEQLPGITTQGLNQTHWPCVCLEDGSRPAGQEYRDYTLERRLAALPLSGDEAQMLSSQTVQILPQTKPITAHSRPKDPEVFRTILRGEQPALSLLRCLLRESGQDIRDGLERPIGTRWVHYAVPRAVHELPPRHHDRVRQKKRWSIWSGMP